MHPKSPKLLEDIRDAAAFACHYTKDMTSDEYNGNRLLQQVVERQIEKIRVAWIDLLQVDHEVAVRVVSTTQFWNIITNAHAGVGKNVAWNDVHHMLPRLLNNAQQICAEADESQNG